MAEPEIPPSSIHYCSFLPYRHLIILRIKPRTSIVAMLGPVYLDILTFFYPIGNTPAVSLTRDLSPEQKEDVLLLGCGDARNILFTLYTEQNICP